MHYAPAPAPHEKKTRKAQNVLLMTQHAIIYSPLLSIEDGATDIREPMHHTAHITQ